MQLLLLGSKIKQNSSFVNEGVRSRMSAAKFGCVHDNLAAGAFRSHENPWLECAIGNDDDEPFFVYLFRNGKKSVHVSGPKKEATQVKKSCSPWA